MLKVLLFIIIALYVIYILYITLKNKVSNQEDYATIKGKEGEDRIKQILQGVNGLEVFNNIYLPKKYGFTEIDLIAFGTNVMFVIESKNYSCKITGNDTDEDWKLLYRNGSTYTMYNPILQNDNHIKVLNSYLREVSRVNIKSIIVFSDRSDINGIQNKRRDVFLCNERDLKSYILKEMKSENYRISEVEYRNIYKFLRKFSNVPENIKKQHIKNIKNYKRR